MPSEPEVFTDKLNELVEYDDIEELIEEISLDQTLGYSDLEAMERSVHDVRRFLRSLSQRLA